MKYPSMNGLDQKGFSSSSECSKASTAEADCINTASANFRDCRLENPIYVIMLRHGTFVQFHSTQGDKIEVPSPHVVEVFSIHRGTEIIVVATPLRLSRRKNLILS